MGVATNVIWLRKFITNKSSIDILSPMSHDISQLRVLSSDDFS